MAAGYITRRRVGTSSYRCARRVLACLCRFCLCPLLCQASYHPLFLVILLKCSSGTLMDRMRIGKQPAAPHPACIGLGAVRLLASLACPCKEGLGGARHSKEGLGGARHSKEGLGGAWHCKEGLGGAWHECPLTLRTCVMPCLTSLSVAVSRPEPVCDTPIHAHIHTERGTHAHACARHTIHWLSLNPNFCAFQLSWGARLLEPAAPSRTPRTSLFASK